MMTTFDETPEDRRRRLASLKARYEAGEDLTQPTEAHANESRVSVAVSHWNQVQERTRQMMDANQRLDTQCYQLKALCLVLVVALLGTFAWSWFTIHDLGGQADAILLKEVSR